MAIHFSKMHGLGNDFVFIDTRTNGLKLSEREAESLSIKICDRNHGVGADGIVIIDFSETCDLKFTIFNSDGSRAKMCGNAIRCLSWLVYEKDKGKKTSLKVETDSGTVSPTLIPDNHGKNHMVRVDMGKPVFDSDKIPCLLERIRIRDEPIDTDAGTFRISAVSMGNPHAVIFWDDLENLEIEKIGRQIENHRLFPQRTNTEFIKKLSDKKIMMRVWERGAGETLACGTGACAAAVVCIDSGFTEKKVTVILKGGSLDIEWDGKDGNVFMTGPATHVFDGVIEI